MALGKLPRIQRGIPIVDSAGRALDYFLRLLSDAFTMIERNENEQNDLLSQIQQVQEQQTEQLELILAAQARADEAYNFAESAGGSKYIDFDGPYPSVSGIINGQTPNPKLVFSLNTEGGTIDANTSWNGVVDFSENNGAGPVSLGTIPLSINSNGLSVGGNWGADDTSLNFESIGSLGGNVTYSVAAIYVSGANISSPPTIRVNLTTTPVAS